MQEGSPCRVSQVIAVFAPVRHRIPAASDPRARERSDRSICFSSAVILVHDAANGASRPLTRVSVLVSGRLANLESGG
jgi:hypothetical protein